MQNPKALRALQMSSVLSQHRLAVATKFSVIAASVIVLYMQDLSIVFNDALKDESTFHILAIPFLLAYLLFRKRKMINATLYQPPARQAFQRYFGVITGTLLCTAAIFTYWYGSYTFTPLEYHMITLPLVTAGLILILFGARTLKQLAFPVVFLFFLTPPPSELLYAIGSALSNFSASASNTLVNTFGIHTVLSNNYGSPLIALTRPDSSVMNFSVDIACSGIYSLIGFLIFALVIAYITRGKIRNKLAILIMGIPLIVALNIIRISAIITIGYHYGDDLALQVFHTIGATVLMFIGTLMLLGVTEKFFKKPKNTGPCLTCHQASPHSAQPVEFCPSCGKLFKHAKIRLQKSDFIKIGAIALVVALLLSIQTPVFALTQGPAQVINQTPSGPQVNTTTSLLPNITDYRLNYVYRDTSFESVSGQDASLIYTYSPLDRTKPTIWVAVELSTSQAVLHRWETCLVNFPLSQGQQLTVRQLDLRDVEILENPPVLARYFAFQYRNTNQTQVVFYWYETAKFDVNGTAQTENIKMSLIMYPESPAKVQETEDYMLPVALAIKEYWQPIRSWASIALLISQNGLILAQTFTVLLVAAIFFGVFLDRREKQYIVSLYGKLREQDKLLLQAVSNAQKQRNSSTQNVIDEFEKLYHFTGFESWVANKLEEAYKAGLVEKFIINNSDVPTVHWRNQIPSKHPRFFIF